MSAFPRRLRIAVAALLAALSIGYDVAPAAAGLMASRLTGDTVIASTRDADRLAIERTLELRVVAQKLRDYGVSPEEVRARLAGMSDEDLHTLASAAHGLPSGSDALGVIVTLLVIVLLVIIIMKLMNKEITVK